MKNTNSALAWPPGGGVTWVGVTPQFGQDGQSGGGDVVRVTVPLNPFMLVTTIVDVAFEPAGTFWLNGLAEIVKPGWLWPVTVRAPVNCAEMKPPPCAAVPVSVSL